MKSVKDKSIVKTRAGYFARVEYYQDTPERDGDVPQERLFATRRAAQLWLDKFPRDIWDGFEDQYKIDKQLDKREAWQRRLKTG